MNNIEKYKAGNILHGIWINFLHLKDSFVGWQQHSSFFFPLVIVFAIFLILAFVIYTLWKLKKYLNQESVLLEITPPAFTEKTAYTTQQLFSVFHDLGYKSNFFNSLLGRKTIFSLEIVSNRTQGIRYIIRSPKEEADILQKDLLSYLPDVKVKEVEEYLPKDIKSAKVIEWKLKNHFAFPLKKQNALDEHDPVAYITGAMTKLEPSELISFQIVLSPTLRSETNILSNKILHNEDVLGYINRPKFAWYIQVFYVVFKILFKLINKALTELAWAISELSHGSSAQPSYNYASYQQNIKVPNARPARILSSFEQQAVLSIQEKIDQKLFAAKIRALVIVSDKNNQKQRLKGLKNSLAPFSVPKYQSFIAKYNFPTFLVDRFRVEMFKNRLLSGFFNKSNCVLSASEISDLYHFPYSRVTQTENIVKVHSKELPAPISLKKDVDELDVVFAKNTYGGQTTMIGLTKEERIRHQYIIGATGSGKSTMLLSMISEDLKNGKGICVIDPHGDLAEAVRNLVPKERINDFIYINPDDLSYPVGINLLELTPGLNEDDSLREKQFIMESVISMFRKIFSDDTSGAGGGQAHRIEYILRNTILTAFTIPNATIFTIYDLLDDPEFRNKTIAKLQDQRLKKFWKYEFGKAGDYQRVKMVSGVTARIGRFLFSPSAQRILEQEKSTINFDDILDSGKIVVCNLSRGRIGEDTAEVLGIMILNKIQLAALRRARIEEKTRRPFYLYVDEFQHFATQSFIKMLSEARKYALNLIIAEQSTSQLMDRTMVFNILANVGTVVCFKSANPKDEEIMLPQFTPYVKETEIMNLPSFRFYMKISATSSEEPFSGETILIKTKKDPKKIEELIVSSRKKYAIFYKKPTSEKTPIHNEKDKELEKKSPEKGAPKKFMPEDEDES